MSPEKFTPVAYVAGPMTGYPRWNFDAFHAAEKYLKDRGYVVHNPARYDEESGFDPNDNSPLDPAFYEDKLREDHDLIDASTTILLLPGWSMSNGARREVQYAASRPRRPAFYLFDPAAPNMQYVTSDELLTAPDPFANQAKAQVMPQLHGNVTRIDAAPSYTPPVDPALERLISEEEEIKRRTGEVRTVNETTGGAKGVKPERFDLFPGRALQEVARVYGRGAEKYGDRNWEKGYEWSKSFAAMQRHSWLFWSGEDFDQESGCHHLASVVFHALAMMTWGETHPEMDNRPEYGRIN